MTQISTHWIVALTALSLLQLSKSQEQNVFNDETKVVYKTKLKTVTKTEYVPYTANPTGVANILDHKEVFIHHHNHYRSLHGAKKLAWSDELFEQCDAFIKHDFPVCDGNIHHSDKCINGDVGEIITIGFKSVEEFMSSIYATNEAFDFSSYEDVNPATSKFFKQLVWNSTQEFACSMMDCGDYYSNIIVCQYDNSIDQGNVTENVFPPL